MSKCGLEFSYLFTGGVANKKDPYEVLVAESTSRFKWVPSSNGLVPQRAIPGGYAGSGETVYIGRVVHEGEMICGKVHPSYGVLFVAHEGKECSHSTYEILVMTEKTDYKVR